jgi:hypothetical protein
VADLRSWWWSRAWFHLPLLRRRRRPQPAPVLHDEPTGARRWDDHEPTRAREWNLVKTLERGEENTTNLQEQESGISWGGVLGRS